MAISKYISTDGMLNYEGSSSPTTQQQYQEMIKSWDATFQNLLDAGHLWQPGKDYLINQVVESPSMIPNTVAKVTTPGTSGITEPTWGAVGDTVADGTVSYLIVAKTTETATADDVSAGTDKYKAITPAVMADLLKDIYKQAKLDAHPVGSIYESTDSTSPAALFGGTWEAMDPGRVLVSAGTASTGTVYNAGDKGGEEKHQLSERESPPHTHSGRTNTDGSHSHGYIVSTSADAGGGYHIRKTKSATIETWNTSASGNHSHSFVTDASGGNQPHNNMMPFEVIYRWKRTA
nr:MAG TPA_asm: baseplate wedge protein [Caudoviricetes sp.]